MRIRQAALALLDGDIQAGERLSAEATELGRAIDDSDTDNVRMSQRLEIVRARNDPDELRVTAAEAVRWWVGAPAHAYAVAAGFLARAGDRDGARRALDTVLSLDWRADRSYLWSVFVGELTAAAIALDDRPLSSGNCSTISGPSPTPTRSTARWSASWVRTPTGSGCSPLPSVNPCQPGTG